jgi:methylglutaconyl-CoA hydratase
MTYENLDDNVVICAVDRRGVARLTLNRGRQGNAYNSELLTSLGNAVDALTARQDVRAVVLTGAGRHFQVGADLNWLSTIRDAGHEVNLEASHLTAATLKKLRDLPVPVMAVVHGSCFGGGTGILAASDIVVASESATFSVAEVRWGLQPSIILPQLIAAMSERQVRRYALTGERFGAAKAASIGLVHEVVAPDELHRRSDEILGEILRNGPMAVRATKAHVDSCHSSTRGEMNWSLLQDHSAARQSVEAAEGLASFLEDRLPRWQAQRTAGNREDLERLERK